MAALGAVAAGYFAFANAMPVIEQFTTVDRAPSIWPDYSDAVIPPNIAPLNFLLSEPGERRYVKIHAANGDPIEVACDGQKVVIPPKRWRRLLEANRGRKVFFDCYVQDESGQWSKFRTVSNTVAAEPIDSYLAYRLITPIYNMWKNVGVYQRDLESFDQSPILRNTSFAGGCVNCHTFRKNDPANMLMNVRPSTHKRPGDPRGGLVVARGGKVIGVVNTKTDFNPIPAIYLSWHPSGKVIGFSTNRITQFFHSQGENRDVFDHRSDLGLYRVDTNTVTTSPKISRPDRMETYPTWSPDGKYLYFCSAPQLPIRRYKAVRYDLMRIGYDLETDTWGEVETVLASSRTHLSVTHPRISPDGRWLLFCMCSYGNFSIYRPDSDLYMMDLASGEYRRLGINSDRCESYHSWSSNGRWIVFSSKRIDGLFARPHFSYVDQTGKVYKPFVLPQRDPAFYESYLNTYNVPEFMIGPVPVSERDFAKALHSPDKQLKAKLDPKVATSVTPGRNAKDIQYRPGPGG